MWPAQVTVCAREGSLLILQIRKAHAGVRLGGQPGGPLAAWRGWMDAGERLFHAPFTAAGLFICLCRCCHQACLMRATNAPHWWIVPGHPTTLSVRTSVDISQKCPSRWEPPQRTNVHLSTRATAVVDSRVLRWGKGCFSESSAGKVSAEMWSHADCAHHKWFLSAGGNLLAPSPAVFSHKMPLKRLLSVTVILAGTLTHTENRLHTLLHFVSALRLKKETWK